MITLFQRASTHLSGERLPHLKDFFIKGLEMEKQGNTQLSIFQELARGYGVNNYKEMLATTKANKARLKTASEFKMSGMQSDEFKASAVRNALAAIYRAEKKKRQRPAGTGFGTNSRDIGRKENIW